MKKLIPILITTLTLASALQAEESQPQDLNQEIKKYQQLRWALKDNRELRFELLTSFGEFRAPGGIGLRSINNDLGLSSNYGLDHFVFDHMDSDDSFEKLEEYLNKKEE